MTTKGKLPLSSSWQRTFGKVIFVGVVRRRDIDLGKWGLWEFVKGFIKKRSKVEKVLHEGVDQEKVAPQRRLLEQLKPDFVNFVKRLANQGGGFGALEFLVLKGFELMKLAALAEDERST